MTDKRLSEIRLDTIPKKIAKDLITSSCYQVFRCFFVLCDQLLRKNDLATLFMARNPVAKNAFYAQICKIFLIPLLRQLA